MRREIPKKNWHTALADAINDASDGDIIVCHNETMKEIGELAHGRMCPNKKLTFENLD